MGASCTPCDSNEHPNAAKSNTQRKRIQYKSMDSEDISDGILPNAVQSSDEIVDCFKAAVKSMDEDLVMHLDQRFPDLNMLDMLLRGETILHLAVKNKKHKLLIYCLENGLDVQSVHKSTLSNQPQMEYSHRTFRFLSVYCVHTLSLSMDTFICFILTLRPSILTNNMMYILYF